MLITVTMPSLNAAKHISVAINSVLNQSFQDWELLIIDGGSTDDTFKIIKEVSDDRVKLLICEKPGIYAAINYGNEKAEGEFVINLNTDDCFSDNDVLNKYVGSLDGATDVYYSNINYVRGCGKNFLHRSGNFSVQKVLLGWLPPHPSYLVRRDILIRNKFDERYRIAGDYEWFLRMSCYGQVRFRYLDFTSVNFKIGGISTDLLTQFRSYREDQLALTKHFNTLGVFITIFKKMRKLRRKLWEFMNV